MQEEFLRFTNNMNLKLLLTTARNNMKSETLVRLIEMQEDLKINQLPAHDKTLDDDVLRLIRTVKVMQLTAEQKRKVQKAFCRFVV